jgi:hypothetical protein
MEITVYTSTDVPFNETVTMPDGRLLMHPDFAPLFIMEAERVIQRRLTNQGKEGGQG